MASVAFAVVCAACTPGPHIAIPATTGVAIGTVTLGLSNVHVILGEHPVLVDTGSPGELPELEHELGKLGVALADVRCAVVTHGHSDHAGNARGLQLRGIKIIAGVGDLWRMLDGIHGHLTATSTFAVFLKLIIPSHYEPFWPDIRVRDRFDLGPCGVDGEVIALSGHTAGSLVVLVAGGKVALVGDLFRGGALAGYIHPSEPEEHFYQDDIPLVHRRIHELLARGPHQAKRGDDDRFHGVAVEQFVLGHGGPSSRVDVIRVFGEK